jgi:hypothetical protein
MMRRVLTLTAVALAVYLAAGQAGARDAVAPAMQASPVQVLPPDLVALEQKMAQLRVRSERFSEVTRGTVKLTNESNGRPVGRSRYVSLNGSAIGEASISPSEGEISITSSAGRSKKIYVGSAVYVYTPNLARLDGGRPWVRFRVPGITIFPYHGSSEEVNAGGTGPYARLINLLATAIGEVVQVGPVTVDGQQAIEFEAAVDPLALVRGLTQEDVANLEKHPPVYHLAIYLTESGLPVRVVESLHKAPGLNTISSSSTIDILASEVTVAVKAPPASRTISEAQMQVLENRSAEQKSKQ